MKRLAQVCLPFPDPRLQTCRNYDKVVNMHLAYESSTSISLPFIVNIIVMFLCLDRPY